MPNPPLPTERLVKLLEAVRSRQNAYSFRLVQAQLRSAGMPSAMGWDALINKYRGLSLNAAELTAYESELTKLQANSWSCGARAVFLYQLDQPYISKLCLEAPKLLDKNSVFAKKFPFPVDDAELRKASRNGQFVSFTNDGQDLLLYACAKRSYTERENISVQALGNGLPAALHDFTEIVGIRHVEVQSFDCVAIREGLKQVEIHVDLCCPLAEADLEQTAEYYRLELRKLLGKGLPPGTLEGSRNLFPFIKKFYDTQDGSVARMGHTTSTNSTKEERMRSRRSDLRKELFHEQGIGAIPSTDSYSIMKGWETPSASHTPSIMIPGKSSQAGQPTAYVGYAFLDQCACKQDLNLLLSKLR